MSEKRGGRGDSQESQDGEVTSRDPTVPARSSPQISFGFLQQSTSFKNSPETNISSESYFTSQREVRRKKKAMENSPSSSQTKSFPSFTSTQPTSSPHHKRPPSPSSPHSQRLTREASFSPPPSKHPPRERMEDRDAGSTGSKSKSHVPQHSEQEDNMNVFDRFDVIPKCATKGQQTVTTDFNSGFDSEMHEERDNTDPGDDMEEVDDREEEEEREMDSEDENEGQNVLGSDPGWDRDEFGGAPDGLGEKEPGPEHRPGPGPRPAPGEKRPGPNTQLREEMDTVIQKRGLSSDKTKRAPDSVNFGGDAGMGKGDDVDMREHGNSNH